MFAGVSVVLVVVVFVVVVVDVVVVVVDDEFHPAILAIIHQKAFPFCWQFKHLECAQEHALHSPGLPAHH